MVHYWNRRWLIAPQLETSFDPGCREAYKVEGTNEGGLDWQNPHVHRAHAALNVAEPTY